MNAKSLHMSSSLKGHISKLHGKRNLWLMTECYAHDMDFPA